MEQYVFKNTKGGKEYKITQVTKEYIELKQINKFTKLVLDGIKTKYNFNELQLIQDD